MSSFFIAAVDAANRSWNAFCGPTIELDDISKIPTEYNSFLKTLGYKVYKKALDPENLKKTLQTAFEQLDGKDEYAGTLEDSFNELIIAKEMKKSLTEINKIQRANIFKTQIKNLFRLMNLMLKDNSSYSTNFAEKISSPFYENLCLAIDGSKYNPNGAEIFMKSAKQWIANKTVNNEVDFLKVVIVQISYCYADEISKSGGFEVIPPKESIVENGVPAPSKVELSPEEIINNQFKALARKIDEYNSGVISQIDVSKEILDKIKELVKEHDLNGTLKCVSEMENNLKELQKSIEELKTISTKAKEIIEKKVQKICEEVEIPEKSAETPPSLVTLKYNACNQELKQEYDCKIEDIPERKNSILALAKECEEQKKQLKEMLESAPQVPTEFKNAYISRMDKGISDIQTNEILEVVEKASEVQKFIEQYKPTGFIKKIQK